MHSRSPDTPRTPVPFGTSTRNRNTDESGNEGDDDYDGEMSVAGTETTDTNSLGSLTSVD